MVDEWKMPTVNEAMITSEPKIIDLSGVILSVLQVLNLGILGVAVIASIIAFATNISRHDTKRIIYSIVLFLLSLGIYFFISISRVVASFSETMGVFTLILVILASIIQIVGIIISFNLVFKRKQ